MGFTRSREGSAGGMIAGENAKPAGDCNLTAE
jgi:hypothetical protein